MNPTGFEITESETVDYVLEVAPEFFVCDKNDTLLIPVKVTEAAIFSEIVTLSVSNSDDFKFIDFEPTNKVTPSASVVIKVVLKDTVSSSQMIEINAESSVGHLIESKITPLSDEPGEIIIEQPTSFSSNISQMPFIRWTPSVQFTKYEVTVSEYYTGMIVDFAVVESSFYTVQQELDFGGLYKVQITAINDCGETVESAEHIFATKGVVCVDIQSTDLPKTIPAVSFGDVVVNSIITIENEGLLESVSLNNVQGEHSYIGDLLFTLYAPNGTAYKLIDGRCGFQTDFDFSIDVGGGSDVSCPLNLSKKYIPEESLSSLKGTSIKGDWELEVYDYDGDGDGGSFDTWSLGLCYSFVDENEIPEIIVNEVQAGEVSVVLNSSLLLVADVEGSSLDVVFTIVELPNHGVVKLSGLDLKEGDVFSQDDIDNALVSYSNTGNGGLDSVKVFVNDKTGGLTQPFYLFFRTDTLTGLDEEVNDVRVVVTNPFSDHLKIDTGSDVVRHIRLYNMFGQEQKLDFGSSNSMEFSTTHLARGTYILELVFEKSTVRFQLVKE